MLVHFIRNAQLHRVQVLAGVCKTSGSRPNGTTYTYSVNKLFIFLVFVSQIFLCKKYIEKNASTFYTQRSIT